MEEMPKNYDPQSAEPELIDKWMSAGCYQRSKGVGDCTVVIPPPNVTGILHMGHAMDDTIQDTFIRYNRMRGRSTRWILGTDHAGIATQTKVDKKLKSEGISRLEIGREKFLDACWDWTHEYGGTIVSQIKRMGCSIDFDDEKFTMSPEFSKAVRRVFVDWYHDGLIYRGKRIVNWCPHCRTAISDDEAEYHDEKGHLWFLRYPLVEPVDGIEYITVATTRPETMLGDTGIAVSPSDPEKQKLIGKKVMLPIVNREIEIFSDWHVDANFGTGFVKVTPAHDPNDYAMGQTHDLEQINIFDETAHVVDGYGEFSGMDRDECREAVVAWFDEHGLLDHIEELDHSVMHCYRCDTALEPWLSEQWFVAVDKLKERATEVVKSGEVTFHPERWTQTYLTWMENLKDWCISRQLWWGHRIPVFYCEDCGWEDALMEDTDVCPKCGGHHVHQDEDVLDTWFSSQLWTFATQGWPDDNEELAQHHPTKVLVTARDIIALWVARMIMSSLYFTDQIPFHDVYIYATILAKDGSRMSKSKGNGVNPMDLMEKYGADAMRYNLLTLITNNQDVKFDANIDKKTRELIDSPRTEQARSFVTKIWNASRFVQMNLEGYVPGDPKAETPEDAWMLSRLAKVVAESTEQLESYNFGDYSRNIQSFFWGEVCDWYIELCKGRLLDGTPDEKLQVQRNLVFVLDASMRLLHPVMPFVTESVWDALPASGLDDHDAQFLMVAKWPEPADFAGFVNDKAEHDFDLARRVVSAVRSTRARYRLSPKAELAVAVRCSQEDADVLAAQDAFIRSVGRVSALAVSDGQEKPEGSVSAADGTLEIFVELGGLVDLAAEAKRLEKELAKAEKDLASVSRTLGNAGFVAKAAPAVIEKKRAQQAELEQTIAQLKDQISDFS
ncbi:MULTISPECIES: valine--tRNA ligase [Atopobiaceae]|uniref:Valine--tRNA ligase n=1 Tax=Parafannyhessea umbonata TaxID=604330 RepID=A0A1H6JF57_9ACTN|nr:MULTISPECIES: valine--tRNA ligase [Atopobiaceae]SEH59346.1 valyl-tRNA synthetase [Parafannyhessea umbonata]SJZ53120.1 valyl-tRNA synthetase [Olsenella sp. KH1P3]